MIETEGTDYLPSEGREESEHALNLKFTIGYSSNMIGAVHNLTFENKKVFLNYNKLPLFILSYLGNIFSICTYRCNL